jgi:hypothetical protein
LPYITFITVIILSYDCSEGFILTSLLGGLKSLGSIKLKVKGESKKKKVTLADHVQHGHYRQGGF